MSVGAERKNELAISCSLCGVFKCSFLADTRNVRWMMSVIKTFPNFYCHCLVTKPIQLKFPKKYFEQDEEILFLFWRLKEINKIKKLYHSEMQ